METKAQSTDKQTIKKKHILWFIYSIVMMVLTYFFPVVNDHPEAHFFYTVTDGIKQFHLGVIACVLAGVSITILCLYIHNIKNVVSLSYLINFFYFFAYFLMVQHYETMVKSFSDLGMGSYLIIPAMLFVLLGSNKLKQELKKLKSEKKEP